MHLGAVGAFEPDVASAFFDFGLLEYLRQRRAAPGGVADRPRVPGNAAYRFDFAVLAAAISRVASAANSPAE